MASSANRDAWKAASSTSIPQAAPPPWPPVPPTPCSSPAAATCGGLARSSYCPVLAVRVLVGQLGRRVHTSKTARRRGVPAAVHMTVVVGGELCAVMISLESYSALVMCCSALDCGGSLGEAVQSESSVWPAAIDTQRPSPNVVASCAGETMTVGSWAGPWVVAEALPALLPVQSIPTRCPSRRPRPPVEAVTEAVTEAPLLIRVTHRPSPRAATSRRWG